MMHSTQLTLCHRCLVQAAAEHAATQPDSSLSDQSGTALKTPCIGNEPRAKQQLFDKEQPQCNTTKENPSRATKYRDRQAVEECLKKISAKGGWRRDLALAETLRSLYSTPEERLHVVELAFPEVACVLRCLLTSIKTARTHKNWNVLKTLLCGVLKDPLPKGVTGAALMRLLGVTRDALNSGREAAAAFHEDPANWEPPPR